MKNKIKIILADDHRIFRDGIISLLSDCKEIEIIDVASDGEELLDKLKENMPDLIILDINMPKLSGLEAAVKIKDSYPCIKICILSMHTSQEFVLNALHVGIDGYLPKDISKNELLEAIQRIHIGEKFFNRIISEKILMNFVKKDAIKKEELTQRELEILKQVVEGYSNKEIASELSLSSRTVECHKNNMMKKFNLKSTPELIIYAIKNKIVDIKI
jgi:DNA-binding NarL/FixJ family response regulator